MISWELAKKGQYQDKDLSEATFKTRATYSCLNRYEIRSQKQRNKALQQGHVSRGPDKHAAAYYTYVTVVNLS